MNRNLLRALVVTGALVAAVAGATTGAWMGRLASAPEQRTLTLEALDTPADAPVSAARSAGGFTGFDGFGLRGEVLRSGTVESLSSGTVVITGPESRLSIRYSRPDRFFTVIPATQPLRAGELIQVMVRGNVATAVLRVPAGIEQGANR